jgi:hypothetical protein
VTPAPVPETPAIAVPPPTPARQSRTSAAPSGATAREPAREDAATPQAIAPDPVDVDQIDEEIDQLSVRAGAVNNSLDRLQREQAGQGLGLRGDMAARQQSMNLNLARAQQAVEKRDVLRAKKFRDAAQSDLETLERFLGR